MDARRDTFTQGTPSCNSTRLNGLAHLDSSYRLPVTSARHTVSGLDALLRTETDLTTQNLGVI